MNSKIIKAAGVFATAALGIMLMGGCASQGSSSVADSSAKPGQTCTYDAGLGSHIGSRHCMSTSRYESKQKAAHKQVQRNADVGAGAGTGGGHR